MINSGSANWSRDIVLFSKGDCSLSGVEGSVELLKSGSTEVDVIQVLGSFSESEEELVLSVCLLNVVSRLEDDVERLGSIFGFQSDGDGLVRGVALEFLFVTVVAQLVPKVIVRLEARESFGSHNVEMFDGVGSCVSTDVRNVDVLGSGI